MDEPREITILLLGDADCGKSTFLSSVIPLSTPEALATRISKGSKGPTSKGPVTLLRDGDQPFLFDINFNKQGFRFEFFDTASPQNWTLLNPDVVVICYDISTRLTLIHAQRFWRPEVTRRFAVNREVPILLLGLKRDLRSEKDPNGIIYPQEAYRIAQELRCDKYMECSAVTGELVHEVFEDICKTAAMSAESGGGLSEGGCEIM